MEGLISVNNEQFFSAIGRHFWGTATYNRKLTKEETEHYDMEWVRTEIGGKIE